MNSALKTLVVLALTATLLHAEDAPAFVVQEQDASTKTWVQTNELGQLTSTFVEMATGLSRWDSVLKKWSDADASIEIAQGPEGGAVAPNGQHRLILSADANSQNATVDVEMPDGQRIQIQTIGIALTSLDNLRSMFIGEVKQSIGEQIDANTVIYDDAFTPIKASLRVRNTLSGFQSDVILQEKIDPAEWGFDVNNCRLEAWSQIIQSPAAQVSVDVIPGRRVGEADHDEQIAFGTMAFAKGTAFRSDTVQPGPSEQLSQIRVAKEFANFPADNLSFLIEAVPFLDAKPQIDALPVNEARVKPAKDALERAIVKNSSGKRAKPGTLLSQVNPKGPRNRAMASLEGKSKLNQPGFVIDYALVTTTTNMTFKGDTTYYIGGDVILSGTTVIEGGTVLKYTNNISPTITVNGAIVCNTGPYRPAVLTSKDDDSVGHVLPGSSGTPTNLYAGSALKLSSGSAVNLHHIRSSYAANGIQFWSGGGELKHAQLVNCGVGVSSYSSATVYLRNVLIHNTNSSATALYGNGSTIKGEHLTINGAANGFVNGASTTLTLTNSLMYAVTTPGTYSGTANVINPGTSPFAAIGASSNYLATFNPTLHDMGSTNIEANLAKDLWSMTTDAPRLLTNNISTNTTLWPIAQRDTDIPDIGYHFDPIDYAFKGISLSNATLTFTNGVAVCFAAEEGIYLLAGAKVVSVGLPNRMNRFTRSESVQELPTLWGATGYMLSMFRQFQMVSPAPEVRFRFTDFTHLANVTAHRVIVRTDLFPISLLEFRDSWLRGAAQNTGIYTNSLVTVTMTNNLVEYGDLRFEQGWETTNNFPLALSLRNNTFYGSYMQLYFHTNTWPWSSYDNLFDQVSSYGSGNKPFDNKNNAFISSFAFTGQTNSLAITNAFYQTGSLGRYYIGSGSPLVDAGSLTNAALVGLYHYTTQTNQTKELTNRVDIGFHYVSTDANGQPFDSDGDLLADYFEDANGNGSNDTAETDFRNPDSDGDGVSDRQEIYDHTDPQNAMSVKLQMLASWYFNDPTNYFYGDQGQIPVQQTNVSLINSTSCWDIAAVKIAPGGSTDARLGYAELRPDRGLNISRKSGTILFWYMPTWAPGRGGSSEGTLFSLEGTSNSLSEDFFGIQVGSAGTNIIVRMSPSTTVISLTNYWPTLNQWHQIALTYTPSNAVLYVDGSMGASNTTPAFTNWAPPQKGASTVYIGGRLGRYALGSFDGVITYNCPLEAWSILENFDTVQRMDADHDGLPDVQEIAMGLNPLNPDTDRDHMPDKWELRYGLNPKVNDAGGDADGDSMSNLSEYRSGRNPRKTNSVRDIRHFWKTAAAASELINMSFGASGVTGPAYIGFSDSLNDVWTSVAQSAPVTQLLDSSGTHTPVTLDLSFGTVYSVYKLDGCPSSTISGSGSVNGTSGVDIDPVWVNFDCTFADFGGFWGGVGCMHVSTGAAAGSYTTYEDGSPYFGGYGGYGFGYLHRYGYARYSNSGYGYRGYYGVPWFLEQCVSYGDRVCCWMDVRMVHHGVSRLLRPGVHVPGQPEEPYRPDRQAHDFPGFDIVVDNTTSGAPNRFPVYDTGLKSAIAENLHTLPTDGTCGWMWDGSEANGKMVFRGLEPGRPYRLLVYADVQGISSGSSAYSGKTQAKSQASQFSDPAVSKLSTNVFGFEGVEAGIASAPGKPNNGTISTLFRSLDGTYTVNVPWGGVVYGMQLQSFNPIASAPALSDATDYSYGVDGINLEWSGVDGAEVYDVYRKEGSADWTLVNTWPAYVTSYIDSQADTTISHSYKVVARNPAYSHESEMVSTSTFASPTLDRRPVLNSVFPLRQAFQNAEFRFGASAIEWAADGFDPEGAPLQFIIQSVIAGTLTLTNPGQTATILDEAYFTNLQTNANWTYPMVQVGGSLKWLPPTNALGDIAAFTVVASDGGLVSANSAVVSINVREPSALLWWGDYTSGGSGSGIGYTTWHEIASPWHKSELGWGTQDDPGFVLASTNIFTTGKIPFTTGSPIEPAFPTLSRILNCQDVASSYDSRAALMADGSVWTWGNGHVGQLGDSREFYPSDLASGRTWFSPYSTVAIKVPGLDSVQSIAAGSQFILAAKADGTVWGWGDGSAAQLGWIPTEVHAEDPYDKEYQNFMGSQFPAYSGSIGAPRQIPGVEGIRQVAAGYEFGAALGGNGQAYYWGTIGSVAGLETPRRASVPGRVVQISAGDGHILALNDSGNVYALGDNELFQLGYSTPSLGPSMTPGAVVGLSNAVFIAAGGGHSVAVLADGTVREWGGNDDRNARLNFRTVPNLTNIVRVATSWRFAYAMDQKGNLFQWSTFAYDDNFEDPVLKDEVDEVEMVVSGSTSFALAKANLLTPHGLAVRPGDSEVTILWKPFPDAAAYYVTRSTSAEAPYSFLANVSPVRTTSLVVYKDTTAINGTRYYYKVAAAVAGVMTADSKAIDATPRPVPPQLTVVAQARSRMVELTWRRVDDDTEYRVYRSDSTAPTFQLVGNKQLSYPDSNGIMHDLDPNLVAGRLYTYRVTAQNKSGVGPVSANVVATPTNGTDPIPPTAITLLNQGETAILVQWNRMTAEHGQVRAIVKVAEWTGSIATATNKLVVVGARDQKFYPAGETVPPTDSFVVDGLTKGRQYMFDVCFVDDRGEGPGWYSVSGHTEILGHTGMADEVLVDLSWDQQVAGTNSLYASWHNENVFNYQVELWKGPTNGVNPSNLISRSYVYPDQNGSAEFWMTGLTSGVGYHLRVDQFALTFSQDFDHRQFSTIITPLAGSAPTLPSFTGLLGNQKVTLDWGGSNPAATLATFANWRFVLERLEQNFANEGWIPVADGTNGYRYADTNLANGSGYRYKLTGVDPTCHVLEWPQLPSSTTYYVPGITFTTNNESGWLATVQATALQRAALISWGTLTNQTGSFAASYELRQVLDPFTHESVVLGTFPQSGSHSFTHRFLGNGQKYFYVVIGIDANGDALESAVLNVVPSDTANLAPPENYTAAFGDGRIFVSWDDVPGATVYQVEKPNGAAWDSVGLFAKPAFSFAIPTSASAAYHFRLTPAGPTMGAAQEFTVQAMQWSPVSGAPSYWVYPCNTPNVGCQALTNTLLTAFAEVRIEAPMTTRTYYVYASDSNGAPVGSTLSYSSLAQATAGTTPPAVSSSQRSPTNQVGTIAPRLVSIVGLSTNSTSPTLFTTPTNIIVAATVTGGDNENAPVQRVDFYANGVQIGSRSEVPYEITWINPAGTMNGKVYSLVARAIDSRGLVRDSNETNPASYLKVTMVPVLTAFRTAATDVSLATAGVPLAFDRSYSSQDGEIGILGRGWKTPWDRASMAVPDLSAGWKATHIKLQTMIFDFQETLFHKLDVTLPDGSKQFFGLYLDGSSGYNPTRASSSPDGDDIFGSYAIQPQFYPTDLSSGSLRPGVWNGSFWTPPNPYGSDWADVSDDTIVKLSYTNDVDFNLKSDGRNDYKPEFFVYNDEDKTEYTYALINSRTTTDPLPRSLFNLQSIEDRYGNYVQFTPGLTNSLAAITASNGRSLRFTNQTSGTHAGYLCVYDPVSLAGYTMSTATPVVRYKVSTNLLTEVHRLRTRPPSTAVYDVTKYEYGTNGLLARVISPEGVMVLENFYQTNNSGYLDYQLDALGLKTQIAYTTNATNNVEEATAGVTQSLGGTNLTVQSAVFDASGQVIRATNPAGESGVAGYDEKGQKRFEKDASGNYKTYEYDAQGRVVQATDELGHSSGVEYGNSGQVQASQDANGGTTTYAYSGSAGYIPAVGHPEGSLSSVTDAQGLATEYTYNDRGQILTEIRRGQGMNEATTNRYGYVSVGGDLQWTETVLGVSGGAEVLARTDFTYDANGNRLTESRKRFTVKRISGVVQSGMSTQIITTTSTYDAQGRVVGTSTGSTTDAVADAETQTNGVVFTAAGRQAQSVDYLGRTNGVKTDVRGNVVQTLYADGTVTRTVYDSLGRTQWTQDRTSVSGTDSTGPGTETEYDAAGRVKRIKRWENVVLRLWEDTQYRGYNVANPQQWTMFLISRGIGGSPQPVSVTRTDYDSAGRVWYSIDARGGITGYVYDAAGRRSVVRSYLTETVSPTGTNQPTGTNYVSTGFAYDSNGNQTASTNALGLVTESEYDASGRKWRVVFPLVSGDTARKEQRTAYDGLGRRIMEMDEAGVITAFGYDLGGRLVTVTNDFRYGTNISGMMTAYAYDELGNQTQQVDGLGRTTYFEQDAFGRRAYRFLPGASRNDTSGNTGMEKFSSSKLGGSAPYTRRSSMTDFKGMVTTNDYDKMDRLSVRSIPATAAAVAHSVTNTYMAFGGLSNVVDGLGSRTNYYVYDTINRLKRKDVPEGILTYAYNEAGAITNMSAYRRQAVAPNVDPSALAKDINVAYGYDTFNRLVAVTNLVLGTSSVTRYNYDGVGNLDWMTYANGVKHDYQYSTQNRLTNLVLSRGDGSVLRQYQYALNLTGQRTGVTDLSSGTNQLRRVEYEYDGGTNTLTAKLSRLTKETLFNSTNGPAGNIADAYDKVGNRLTRTPASVTSVDTISSQILTFDQRDLIDTDSVTNNANGNYDANGNTLTASDGYDGENRLVTRGTTTLSYDPDGNRVKKVAGGLTTYFLMDDRNPTGYPQAVAEYSVLTANASPVLRTYIYGLDLISKQESTNGVVNYYGYDGQGSVRLLLSDSTGSATAITDTYDYDAYGMLLALTGSTINPYRYTGEYYDSDLGMVYLRARFYKPDLGRLWTRDAFEGNASDPCSLHKYLYAQGNPANYIDPSGHETLIGISSAATIGMSLHGMYDGTVAGVGNAIQSTILGVQAGKGINEILTGFILDETGLGLAVGAYEQLKEYFQDADTAEMVEYQLWQEEAIAAVAMSIPDGQYGDYDVEFIPQCFVAGTPVACAGGMILIEDIRPGDLVWAWREGASDAELRRVSNCFIHRRNEVVTIAVGTDCFEVTPEHPFYEEGRGWTPVRDVEIGDLLLTSKGTTLPVDRIERQTGIFTVYNFEVEIDHNYFVGEESVITHNVGAAQMRRTLGIQGHSLLSAHHIVSRFSRNVDNQMAISILKSVGISLEHGANGVGLPRSLKARPTVGKFAGYTAHSVVHTDKYYRNLANELTQARALGGRRQVRLTLQSIGDRLRLSAFPF